MKKFSLHTITPARKLPADTAAALRLLADQIDSGLVTSIVIAAVAGDTYEFHMPSSLHDSLVLASLLQTRCLEGFRA